MAPDLSHLGAESQFVREQWTAEDGLPVNSVNALLQSRQGYLWIATYDGLARFDGVRFTVFRVGAHPGLTSNRLVSMLEDGSGALWLKTERQSLVRYQAGTFTHTDSLRGRGGLRVLSFYKGDESRAWFGTDRGLARATADGKVVPVEIEGTSDVEVTDVIKARGQSRPGTLWLATRLHGVWRVELEPDGRSGRVTRRLTGLGKISFLYSDPKGELWIAGNKQTYRRPPGGSPQPLSFDGRPWETPVYTIQPGREGTVWFGTAKGTFFKPSGASVQPFAPRSPSPSAAVHGTIYFEGHDGAKWIRTSSRLYRDGRAVFSAPDRITSVLHDREGNIWVGTATTGLHRLRPAPLRVIGLPEGLPGRNVYTALQARSGAVWLGTQDAGLLRLAGERVTTRDSVAFPVVGPVWALHEDRSGALWAGGHGICRLDGARCRLENLPESFRHVRTRALYEDRERRLWVGSAAGLFRRRAGCSDRPGCWRRFPSDAGPDGMPSGPVRVIHEQSDGTLWMGTNGSGLVRFSDGTFETLSVEDGLPSNLIRAIYEDPRGVLWIGTEDAGLVRLDPRETDVIARMPLTSYRQADGLFDDVIHQILPDDRERLWMSTNRGLFWVPRAELEAFHRGDTEHVQSVSYDERDGMRNREANGGGQPAGMRDRQGRLWFPTQRGVVVVDPAAVVREADATPVVFEHLTTGDTTRRVGPPGQRTPLSLPPGGRSFTVKYTAFHFANPSKIRFRYRLAGFQESWVEAGARREAVFTNVPPGDYTFEAQARVGAGTWSEARAALPLHVAPFFYETWGFYGACLLALLALGASGVRWRTRHLKRRQARLAATVADRTRQVNAQNEQLAEQTEQLAGQTERLRELDTAKSRFFANISHEFRTPLTLSIGPVEDLIEDGDLAAPARRTLDGVLLNNRRLLRLVNQLLDVARLEAHDVKLERKPVELRRFAGNAARAYEPLVERKQITFRHEADDEAVWVNSDPNKLEEIFTNLLSNAFKFTPSGGAVTLRTHGADGQAVVEVEDTGPGIAEKDLPHVFDRFYRADDAHTTPGSGIGLALVRELAALHDGVVEARSEEGEGSTFTVRLPQCAPPPGAPDIIPGAATLDAAPPQKTAPEAVDRTTVLVVDDNAELRAYLRGHLEDDYRVLEAADGADALRTARERLPDCIVSDVMMPRMDGFALLEAVRADDELSVIPVVLLTARAEHEDRMQGLEGGADDYLTKPFRADELRARIAGLIQMRQHLRERFLHGASEPPSDDGAATRQAADENDTDGVADALDEQDAAFRTQLYATAGEHLADPSFGVDQWAEAMDLGRSSFYRRFKDVEDGTPAALLRRLRLERAEELLAEEAGSVTEVAYAVGFQSLSYFSLRFKKRTGHSPSQYAAERDGDEN